MSDLQYKEVELISREKLERDLASGDEATIADALYSATRFSEDWQWPQSICLDRVSSPMLLVRWAAVTCLGDIAFLRRRLDKRRVVAALEGAIKDPTISDPASYSLSMVKQFIEDQP